ncbi:MAG: nickel insertion protein, partial [Thermoleophilia bacterium]|nr:nickel insertion protein [Thermoleophilia bacterium]
AGEAADEDAVGDEDAVDGDRAPGAGVAAGATTPAGAALLAHFADDFDRQPPGEVTGEGFGAARRGLPGRPDVLRVAVVTPAAEVAGVEPSSEHPNAEAESSSEHPNAEADSAPEPSSAAVEISPPPSSDQAGIAPEAEDSPEAENSPETESSPDARPSSDRPPSSDAAAWFGVEPDSAVEPSSAAAISSDAEASTDAPASAEANAPIEADASAKAEDLLGAGTSPEGAVSGDADDPADAMPEGADPGDADAASDAAPDAAAPWVSSPLFGAGPAPGAIKPAEEDAQATDAAPWFAAPPVTLPGTDDDVSLEEKADGAVLTDAAALAEAYQGAGDAHGEAEDSPDPNVLGLADDHAADPDDDMPREDHTDVPAADAPADDITLSGDDTPSGDITPSDDITLTGDITLDGTGTRDGADAAPGGADASDAEAAAATPIEADAATGAAAGEADTVADVAPGDQGAPAAVTAAPPTEHVVLETNIDDMSAELLAHAAEALREAGALDVWMTPALMKKGRPGTVLHVLAAADEQERLAASVFAETTTFGLRVLPVGRLYAEERRETVRIAGHDIGVRLGFTQGRLATVSPEYEDCRRAAAELGRPARVVYEAAQARARSRFSGR